MRDAIPWRDWSEKRKRALIDIGLIIILVLAIAATCLMYLATGGPAIEVKDFTIQEIPSAPHPAPGI